MNHESRYTKQFLLQYSTVYIIVNGIVKYVLYRIEEKHPNIKIMICTGRYFSTHCKCRKIMFYQSRVFSFPVLTGNM